MAVPFQPIDDLLSSYTSHPYPRLPGVALIVVNAAGETLYSNHNGFLSVDSSSPLSKVPFDENTVCWVASITKLMTVVAALQCVDKGLIALDDEIGTILPELSEPDVLEGFKEDGTPITRKATVKITLRMLLNHTNGLTYPGKNPTYAKWDKFHGIDRQSLSGTMRDYVIPVLFEPSKGWVYGPGIDWTGELIHRLTGKPLEVYMTEHIWGPLGIKDTTFHPENRPDFKDRTGDMHIRSTEDGSIITAACPTTVPAKDDRGGGGTWSTATDIAKLLVAVLKTQAAKPGDRNTPLGIPSELIAEMFTDQLGDKDSLAAQNLQARRGHVAQDLPKDAEIGYGLSCVLNLSDVKGMRRKGSARWGGYPTLYWWIDPATGIAGTVFMQLIPPEEDMAYRGGLFEDFQRQVYKKWGKK